MLDECKQDALIDDKLSSISVVWKQKISLRCGKSQVK